MNKNISPAIAIYRALQSNEISKERAEQCLAEYLEKYVEKYALKLRKFGKLSFFYSLFRVALKKTMLSSFPTEGWTTNWVEQSSKVKFARTKTLATDGDCCDFRFIKNK